MSSKIHYVGYWNSVPMESHRRFACETNSRERPDLPFPVPNTLGLPENQKNQLIERFEKLLSKSEIEYYEGQSKCRICGCQNGSAEYVYNPRCSTGTIYHIPSGYLHYIKDHNVAFDPVLLEALNDF